MVCERGMKIAAIATVAATALGFVGDEPVELVGAGAFRRTYHHLLAGARTTRAEQDSVWRVSRTAPPSHRLAPRFGAVAAMTPEEREKFRQGWPVAVANAGREARNRRLPPSSRRLRVRGAPIPDGSKLRHSVSYVPSHRAATVGAECPVTCDWLKLPGPLAAPSRTNPISANTSFVLSPPK